jgi:hypothetical protein
VTASLFIGHRITDRGATLGHATTLSVVGKSSVGGAVLHVTLVERDGTAWSAPVALQPERSTQTLPLDRLQPSRWVLVPQGFPGDGTYWADSTRRSGRIDLSQVERLQLSLRSEDLPTGGTGSAAASLTVDIESITLQFHPNPV